MLATGKWLLFSKIFALVAPAAGLFLFVPWPTNVNAEELDFGGNGGSKSGAGEFSTFVPQGDRALIGKIPAGIKDASIEITADGDLDIELWDGDVFVVGWEANGGVALIHGEEATTGDYNGVQISWSGWNGINGNLGKESIKLSGTTKNAFVMKVFGYEAGNVEVDYSWVGAGVKGPALNGSANFSTLVPRNGRATIGTIPEGVDGLQIDLTSANDLDIELWDGKTFVVGWQIDGRKSLIYGHAPVSGLYNGVRISWSGWDGAFGNKGNESIRISGTTRNPFVMKVFGYQGGDVNADYSWGLETAVALVKPAPTPAPAVTPAPTIAPTPTPSPTPAPLLSAKTVKTWVAGFGANWSYGPNWSPLGAPTGDERIIIEGSASQSQIPIMDVDFTLTTGTLEIGPVNSMLTVDERVTFINNGTVNAKGDVLSSGTMVNNGTYNNEAAIVAVVNVGALSSLASFVNNLGAVLNNTKDGTSSGVIINACGGTVNDSSGLIKVTPAPCIWTGAGGNDNWSNPANWANGVVPPEAHPVVINGEGSSNAKVTLDVDLLLTSRSLSVGSGDTLTIGTGSIAKHITLSVKEPGGLLTNLGTVAITNYSSLQRDSLATIDNVGGTVRNACRGNTHVGGVTGPSIVQDSCFWDGGGATQNWSEAANWDSDTVPLPDDSALIGAGATVDLDTSFSLGSRGILTIGTGQTLNVGDGIALGVIDGGSLWINGVLNLNGGTLLYKNPGLLTNHGTVNINGGTFTSEGDFLANKSDGKINNVGGLISNGAGSSLANAGTLVNDAESTFVHGDSATLVNTGTFTNAGAFNTSSQAGAVTNSQGGTLVNSGILNQGGLGTFSNLAGSKITNSGRINMIGSLFDNRGTIENTGTLEVFHFGSYQNQLGQLENQVGGTFANSGSVSNLSGSTINNAGLIDNNRSLVNAGTMNNLCGGTITGPVNGNRPVVSAC
ncbi:MAG: hypothetical protein HQ475_00005 [SAR202 cluster bacterium]|nr:hypothetical protein [SAR202 cluster bacterium]